MDAREQRRAAREVEREIKRRKLEVVRFSFCDQHGVLRGKTLLASEAASAMRAGVTMTSTLLAKDTAHRTVFPVFAAGGGFGIDEMEGAGDFVMVADPATFRVLPWANATGWMLCDIVFPERQAGAVLDARALSRTRSTSSRRRASTFSPGSRSNSICSSWRIRSSRRRQPDLAAGGAGGRAHHARIPISHRGAVRSGRSDPRGSAQDHQALGLPLRSLEVELGPSQYEFTFAPQRGLEPPTPWCCSAAPMKQVARRNGHLVSFMCRPRLPNMFASGWHLHQSLIDRKSGKQLFVVERHDELLSPLGRHYLAGLLAHARAAAAFTTPTINGYKRYHGVNSMAPDRRRSGRKDNRGVMIRVLGEPGDASTHLENRVGEPLANPYLYMASQIHAGLDGIARKLRSRPVGRLAV